MTDGRELARQYLEQQIVLGGSSVILPDGRIGGSADRASPPRPSADPAIQPSAHPPIRPSAAVPPGLTVELPTSSDLFTADPLQQAASLDAVAQLVAACRKCQLCEGRTNTVPGEGAQDSRLVVVGEGPGKTEDETGRPFVGRAGELLTKILAAIELPRERVYICNVVKCRPPNN
ncbi:MAG: uracil-DNA glycosylase family protein, partial [Gemmatimonadales bacterium]